MKLTVNGRVFNYPDAGTEMGWGEDATAWAEEVTSQLGLLDVNIPARFETPLNPSVTNTDIANLEMEPTNLCVKVQYIIKHGTDSSLYETGELHFQNNSTWSMTRVITSSTLSGIKLSCTTAGQVQYSSGAYTGSMSIVFKNISVIEG